MRVLIVCTGNICRSPALAALLEQCRPDLTVHSVALSVHARSGLRMRREMRELMARNRLGDAAERHRSSRLDDKLAEFGMPDAFVAVTVRHWIQMRERFPHVTCYQSDPPIPDPAWGGQEAFDRVWPLLVVSAGALAWRIPNAVSPS